MFFLLCFIVSFILPFTLFKGKIIQWIPTIVLMFFTIFLGVKLKFFPGEGMKALGELIYLMMFGVSTVGSLFGAIILTILRSKKY